MFQVSVDKKNYVTQVLTVQTYYFQGVELAHSLEIFGCLVALKNEVHFD